MPSAVIDGQLIETDPPRIPVTDAGLLRGDGVFEVVRLYRGRPWALDEHLVRMVRSAKAARLSFSPEAMTRDIGLLIATTSPDDGLLRLVVTSSGRQICLLEENEPMPEAIALATVEYELSPLMVGVKSLSYAANVLAVRLAKDQGAEDALFVATDGHVLEASRASFFCVVDGRLRTPPLTDRILDSITRRHLVEITDAAEQRVTRDDLLRASEAFIASTTKEVLPVRSVDGRALAASPGEVTIAAREALIERIRSRLGL